MSEVPRQNIDVLSRALGGEKPVSSIEGLPSEVRRLPSEAHGTLTEPPEAAAA
jgi:hypothetical protein